MVAFQETIPIKKSGAYVINLDDKQNKGTHWVSFFTVKKAAVHFDSYGIEYIPQEVLISSISSSIHKKY